MVDLSAAPYNDDYDETKDFTKILFQPGVSVQARELNQLQTLLQKQISRFGDNIFSTGTIVSGCNFLFLNPYPYIKIEDQDLDGGIVSPASLANLAIMNDTTGLRAQVIDTADGFVSSDPNAKTLYLNYLNTGYNSNTQVFSSGDTLKIFDGLRNGIEKVDITQASTGFSNNDRVIAVSALQVTTTTGTFANGDYIGDGLYANVQIVHIDSLTLATQNQLILSVVPRPADLANASLNSASWSIANGSSFQNSGNTASGRVVSVIGSGYSAIPVTDGIGAISQVLTLNKGRGYTTLPAISVVSTTNNVSGYGSLVLSPRNYVSKIKVASISSSVGNAYAFGVNEGVIYLKGYFLRVPPQRIIVSKYDTFPNNVSVGFTTTEEIIDANQDPTLNDPAAGDNNGAPGANRLRMNPVLTLIDGSNTDTPNTDIFPIVEFDHGEPYVQRQRTVYSKIGDAIAQVAYDTSGNFFIDPFLVTSRTSLINDPGFTFDLIVDPGSAYINGYKVQTQTNFTMNIDRAIDTKIQNNFSLSVNFGNYIQIHDVGGTFQYNTGDTVTFYDTAKGFLTNTALVKAQNANPVGNTLGTAHIRGLQLWSGTPGTNSAVYNLYVFDIQMANGTNFNNVRSVGYDNGTNKGIADVVLQVNPTTGANQASLQWANQDTLVFRAGPPVIMNTNNAIYTYRSLDQTTQVGNNGIYTKSLASTPSEFWPWSPSSSLTPSQLQTLYVVPSVVDLVSSTNTSGTWSINTTSANAVGSSTAGLTDLAAGDWVYCWGNSSTVDLRQVTQVVNNTLIVFDANAGFANSGVHIARAYPKNVPVPFGYRSGLSANVDANGNVLTLNFGFAFTTTNAQTITLGAQIQRTGVTPTSKTVNRHAFVKILCSNNAGGTNGPWSLGVPDVFRLRGVYIGNSTVSNTGVNYLQNFQVDNNQTTDYLDLSWLYLVNQSNVSIQSSNYILAEFDYYTTSGAGYYTTPSYTQTANVMQILTTDRQSLSNLTTSAATYEIPEFFTEDGQEVDLMGCIDFRPYAQTTAIPGTTPGGAPINPGGNTTFDTTEKKFPIPGSQFITTMESFLPRIDTIYIDDTGKIFRRKGDSITGPGASPQTPEGKMKIADVLIPEYPQIPATKSVSLVEMLNTSVFNTRNAYQRIQKRSIKVISTIDQNQSKRYSMNDIANLDRRLKDVEYYVNLNQLETSVSNMIIPSSANTNVNRYQFGFFADDFTSNGFTDLTNPNYAATTENGDVVPSKLTWDVYGGDDFNGALSFILVDIVSQNSATIGAPNNPNSVPTCAVTVKNTAVAKTTYRSHDDCYGGNRGGLFNFFNLFHHPANNHARTDIFHMILAGVDHLVDGLLGEHESPSNPGDNWVSNSSMNGTIYHYFNAGRIPTLFQVVQGNTVIANSASFQNLTSNDVISLTTSDKNYWFKSSDPITNAVDTGSGYVTGAGKILVPWTGMGETNVSFLATPISGTGAWQTVTTAPIPGSSAGCPPPPPPVSSGCPIEYYDDGAGGCIPVGQGGYTPPPAANTPNVVNIQWTGCGNNLQQLQQQIAAAQASGAQVGSVSVIAYNQWGNIVVNTDVQGLQDINSKVNQTLLVAELSAHASDQASQANSVVVNLGSTYDNTGNYLYDRQTDQIVYQQVDKSGAGQVYAYVPVVNNASDAYNSAYNVNINAAAIYPPS